MASYEPLPPASTAAPASTSQHQQPSPLLSSTSSAVAIPLKATSTIEHPLLDASDSASTSMSPELSSDDLIMHQTSYHSFLATNPGSHASTSIGQQQSTPALPNMLLPMDLFSVSHVEASQAHQQTYLPQPRPNRRRRQQAFAASSSSADTDPTSAVAKSKPKAVAAAAPAAVVKRQTSGALQPTRRISRLHFDDQLQRSTVVQVHLTRAASAAIDVVTAIQNDAIDFLRQALMMSMYYADTHPAAKVFVYTAGALSVVPIGLFGVYVVATLIGAIFTALMGIIFVEGSLLMIGLAFLLPVQGAVLMIAGGTSLAIAAGGISIGDVERARGRLLGAS
ncbi:hypothetical protein BC831DRAFT_544466 [Entophlyctis helioformis]|nr:hypothetical protein BC831DRAFT_544466 [Entophlyctis helioformis]